MMLTLVSLAKTSLELPLRKAGRGVDCIYIGTPALNKCGVNKVSYRAQHIYRHHTLPQGRGHFTMKEINALFEQALQLEAEGNYAAAEPIYMQALEMKLRIVGAADPELSSDFYNAGLLFFVQDKYDQAEQYLMRSLKIDEAQLGADDSELLSTLEMLAEVHFQSGQLRKRRRSSYHRFLDLHARTRGEQGAEICSNLSNLNRNLRHARQTGAGQRVSACAPSVCCRTNWSALNAKQANKLSSSSHHLAIPPAAVPSRGCFRFWRLPFLQVIQSID